MKRNQLTKIIVTIGFLSLFVVAAASSAGAFSSATDECGTSGCHDTLGTLTLSSNSTSVTATTGNTFALEIQAGNGAEWIKVLTGWEDNAEFSISQVEVEDGSADDTNAATGAITVEISFTPNTPGTHTIRIWTAAAGDLATSLDVAVTVTGDTITPTTTTTTTPIDLVGTWRMMMILVPIATGVILLLLGIIAFKKNQ
ncbi:MAG: hypothetical protein ACFFEV_09000 [Candidatus Thorarchaeota archaeon]